MFFTGLVLTRVIITYGNKFSHFEKRIVGMRKRLNSNTYKVMAHLPASVECCLLYLKEYVGEVSGLWREMEFIKKGTGGLLM